MELCEGEKNVDKMFSWVMIVCVCGGGERDGEGGGGKLYSRLIINQKSIQHDCNGEIVFSEFWDKN